jgi:hypothetical protein
MSSRGVVAWAYCETVLLPTAGQREQTPSLDLKVMMGWTVLNLVLEASHGLVPIPLQTHHRHLCAMLATTCATSELLGCASRYSTFQVVGKRCLFVDDGLHLEFERCEGSCGRDGEVDR